MMFALMNRKSAAILILIVLLIAGLNYQLIPYNKDEVLVIETPAEPRGLDPATNYETAGGNIIHNIYETLISYNGSSTTDLKPVLCTIIPTPENGLISPDGINYTFIIRQDVKFHNGDTLTAEDVRYSFERVVRMRQSPSWMIMDRYNPERKKWEWTYWHNHSYDDLDDNFTVMTDSEVDDYNERVDAHNSRPEVINNTMRKWTYAVKDWTVRFKLDAPYSPFLFVLTHTVGSIVNKRTVEAHGGIKEGQKNDWMNEHTVGTGPWKLKKWEPDRTKLTIERFDDYWGENAKLKEVIFLTVHQQTTRIIDLQMGFTDVAYVPTPSLDEVRGKEGIIVDEGAMRLAGYFIAFNCEDSIFSDVRLRQACTLAFDYDVMLNVIYNGLGQRYVGPWVHGMYGYNESIEVWEQDIAAAKDLVQDYKSDNPGSIEVALMYTSSEISSLLAQLFRSNCDEIGIDVTLQLLSWPTLLELTDKGDFDCTLLGWLADFPHPDGNAPTVMSEQKGHSNNAWYENQKVDAWLLEAVQTNNETRRLELYHLVQNQVKRDCPYLWTLQPNVPAVYRDWVKNYVEANNPFLGRYYADVYKEK